MRLHKLLLRLVTPVCIFLVAGCSDSFEEHGEENVNRDGYINITLRSSSLTRATEDGVDKYNENLIESAVLLLYPADNTAGSLDTSVPAVSQTFTGLDAKSTTVLQVVLSDANKATLFGTDGTKPCRAYVFTNLPAAVLSDIKAHTTADAIKKMTVTSPFESNEVQQSFVMDGTGTVSLASDGKSAEGKVEVKRAAAKVTLAIRVPETIQNAEGEDAVVWYSQLDNMKASIINGVKTSFVVPNADRVKADADYYSMPTQAMQGDGPRSMEKQEGVSETEGFPYVVNIPFYTYPNSWSEDAEESHRTFITLMVPWREGQEGAYRTSYYQVPINRTTDLVRNVSYKINLNVGVLGSFVPDEPFEMTDCSYTAVNWSEEPIAVSISDYRYLVVDEDYYVVNNEPSISIPVYSSHPVTVTNVTATYYRYAVTNQGNEYPVVITDGVNTATGDYSSNNGRTIWQCSYTPNSTTDANGILNLNHEMIQWTPYRRTSYNNYREITQEQLVTYAPLETSASTPNLSEYKIVHFRPTSNAEYSRFEFLITIQHTGNSNYSQTIRVVQYPAMYIETRQNYYTGNSTTAANGNMYVNMNQRQLTNDDDYNWLTAYGLSTSTNANPNQYILTINNLNTSDYIIGDPRSHEYTNLGFYNTTTLTSTENLNSNWYRTQDMDGVSRGLTYYYPTDSDNSKMYYVAPKVRIASSYGVAYSMTYEYAQRRCASYQEMMAPAGRWRIPTVGEIEYLIYLSNQGYIPALFSSKTDYWSAQGIINTGKISNGKLPRPSDLKGSASVRCVYDEWFWGNDTVPGTGDADDPAYMKTYPFTWGDREIDFSTTQTRSSNVKGGAKSAARLIDIIRTK